MLTWKVWIKVVLTSLILAFSTLWILKFPVSTMFSEHHFLCNYSMKSNLCLSCFLIKHLILFFKVIMCTVYREEPSQMGVEEEPGHLKTCNEFYPHPSYSSGKKKKSSRHKLLKTVRREINLCFTENCNYFLQII